MQRTTDTALGWGLLGPEKLESSRRTRTLEVAAAVRDFNDLAVPGMGGVWFAKQLMLALLGVAVSERLADSGIHVPKITSANTIEALACWMALRTDRKKPDLRIRGREKLSGVSGMESLSFAQMRKPGFYVTQPMRMASVQPLRALGLVEGVSAHFNGFRCTRPGLEFLDLAFRHQGVAYRGRDAFEVLVSWAKGDLSAFNHDRMQEALSPATLLPKPARDYLRDRILDEPEHRRRRAAALSWANSLRSATQKADWGDRPEMISAEHWSDLRTGALFFDARDTVIELLDKAEAWIGNTQPSLSLAEKLPENVSKAADAARSRCLAFLDAGRDPTADKLATDFCRQLSVADNTQVLREAVRRDGRVLRLRDDAVVAGAGFVGHAIEPDADGNMVTDADEPGAAVDFDPRSPWPDNASPRLHRLFQMNLDLRGELGRWLEAGQASAA